MRNYFFDSMMQIKTRRKLLNIGLYIKLIRLISLDQ